MGGVIDDHTRFLMRFNGNFKVDGNPTPSGNLFIANNGNLITDGSIQCAQYNKTDPFSYTIINTKESLLPELFYDGHPFFIFHTTSVSDLLSAFYGTLSKNIAPIYAIISYIYDYINI